MKRMRHFIYGISFLFVVHNSLVMYINSSYLENFVPVDKIGLVYTVSALLAVIMSSQISHMLRKFGHYRLTMTVLFITILSLIGMLLTKWAWVVVVSFLIHEVMYIAMRGNADIYLEEYSDNDDTGTIRGVFLTVINFSIALSPLIVSIILTDGDYWKIYFIAIAAMLATTLLSAWQLRKVPDIEYEKAPFWNTLVDVWHNKDIKSVFMTTFLLQFFFSWMIIYTPIYLIQHIGFDWSQVGIMFAIMLAPYVLFELPLGRIADQVLGEKEILIAGFIILAIPTALMSFIIEPSFALWAFVLFLTRVGASFIEIMGETYFFKKVDAGNTNTIEFFRDSRPVAYVVGPFVGSVFLSLADIRYMFLALAIIMLSGIYFASRIHDTR